MTQNPILTISIPTYNRARHLEALLSALEFQLKDFEDTVAVIVSNNASTDETKKIIDYYSARIKNFSFHHHKENRGADWNVRFAYHAVNSKYAWVLGDDDIPIQGSIPLLIEVLQSREPDMLFVKCIHHADVISEYSKRQINTCSTAELDKLQFSASVNTMFTFISACITRKSAVNSETLSEALKVTEQTSLPQLAWVYETLKSGQRFYYMQDGMVLTTSGANSGYGVLDVLISTHAKIIDTLLKNQPDLQKAILFRSNIYLFPWLVWSMRKQQLGDFKVQIRKEVDIPKNLSSMLSFKLIVIPIWTLPPKISSVFYQISRVLGRLAREHDKRVVFRKISHITSNKT